MEAAHAAMQGQMEAVLAENAGLKDNMETAVMEQTTLRVEAAQHAMEVKYAAKAAQDFREKQDLLATIEKLKRAADGKSPNRAFRNSWSRDCESSLVVMADSAWRSSRRLSI
ncbi:MAG TPA: hypothetical protein VGJ20_42795 [Xanthobacteraceae bacterium]